MESDAPAIGGKCIVPEDPSRAMASAKASVTSRSASSCVMPSLHSRCSSSRWQECTQGAGTPQLQSEHRREHSRIPVELKNKNAVEATLTSTVR